MPAPVAADVAESDVEVAAPVAEWGRLISSRGEVIEFECQVSGDVIGEAMFYFIVPPGDGMSVRVLSAENANGAPAASDITPAQLEKIVSIKPAGYLRGWHIGVLTIDKRQRGASLKGDVRLRLEIKFAAPYTAPAGLAAAARAVMEQPRGFGRVIGALVENPGDAERFVAAPPSTPADATATMADWLYTQRPEASDFWLKIPVTSSGIYAISPPLLVAAGLRPANYALENFRLFNQGREIPLVEMAGRGNRLDGPNRLFFSGEPPASPYTAINIYWLAYTPGERGHRAAPLATPPDGALLEPLEFFEDQIRWEDESELLVKRGNFLSIEEIRWVGPTLASDQPTTHVFDLPAFDPALQDQVKMDLRFYLNGKINPPLVPFRLTLNGDYTTQFTLLTPTKDSATLMIPAAVVRERGNDLTLEVMAADAEAKPLAVGLLYLDYMDVSYVRRTVAENGQLHLTMPAALSADPATTPTLADPANQRWRQITPAGFTDFPVLVMNAPDPAHPQGRIALTTPSLVLALPPVTEARLHVMSQSTVEAVAGAVRPVNENLRAQLPACDYLFISHRDFMEGVRPLADWHRDKGGLATVIVDVQAIYDEFNFGLESPHAIRNFLQHLALTRGVNAPTYVLLVGDCSSDYKNYARNEVTNLVPSFSYQVGSTGLEIWASDYWYSTVLGNDALGEFILSRLSVNNIEDLGHIVAKTLHYLDSPVLEPWRIHMTSVADDGEFDDEAEVLRLNHTPRHYITKPVYLEDLPWEDNYYLPLDVVEEKKAKVSTKGTAEIISAFNNGTLYMTFFGHGSPNIWSDERLWFGGDSQNSDNLHLTNFERPTFVANLTCNSGAIDYPIPRWNITITEDMMRMKDGGAIGVFAPSGPGFSSAHQKLASALNQGLFVRGLRGVGDAVMRARLQFALSERSPDLIRMFIQLGDPALEIQTPRGRATFQPSSLQLASNAAREITFTARPGFDEGRAWFFLMDDKGRIMASHLEMPFTRGAAKVTIVMTADSPDADWHLSGYFAAADGRSDSAGGALIRRYQPWATLETFLALDTAKESPPDAPRIFTAAIQNQTPLPIEDLQIVLERLDGDQQWKEITKQTVRLAGRERRDIEIKPGIAFDPGLTVLRLRLLNHASPAIATSEAKPERRISIVTPLPDSDSLDAATFIAMPGAVFDMEPRQTVGRSIVTIIDCTVANLHPRHGCEVELALVAGEQNLADASRVVIPAGGQNRFRLVVNTKPGEWPGQYDAVINGVWRVAGSVNPNSNVTTHPLHLSLPMTQSMPPLQDIAIADVVLTPPSPTEGETVFMDVRLVNRGASPARDILVKAYDAPPADGGRELENMTAKAEPIRISYLRPGGETSVRLRWDPFKNLGTKQICVIADPSNTSPDANRANNMITLPVRVRTKAILKGRGIYLFPPTEEERRLGRVRIEAVVENVGETEAVGVVVAIYKSARHQPSDLIAEVIIPRIEPGETQPATATWQLTPEDLTADLRPSFQMFFKGSLQRSSGLAAGETAPD